MSDVQANDDSPTEDVKVDGDDKPKNEMSALKMNHPVEDKSDENTTNKQADNKITSLASRLQLLEKRLKGRVETSCEEESSTVDLVGAEPINVIQAFSLGNKMPKTSHRAEVDVQHEKVDTKKEGEGSDAGSDVQQKNLGSVEDVKSEVDGNVDKKEEISNISKDPQQKNLDSVVKSQVVDDEEKMEVEESNASSASQQKNVVSVKAEKKDEDANTPEHELDNAEESETLENIKSFLSEKSPSSNKESEDTVKMECDPSASVDSVEEPVMKETVEASPLKPNKTIEQNDEGDKSSNDVNAIESSYNDDSNTQESSTKSNDKSEESSENVDQMDKSEQKDSKDSEANKKVKGIDAIARMLRKQQVKTEVPKPETSNDASDEADVDSSKPDAQAPSSETMDDVQESEKGKKIASSNAVAKDDSEPMQVDTPKGPTSEKKEKPIGSSKRMKVCEQCQELKVCKYQVMMQGSDKLIRTHLCDDTCYSAFREKQKQQKLAAKSQTKSSSGESCHVCNKDVKSNSNVIPTVGTGSQQLVLCSQICYRKHREKDRPKRCCSQCKTPIEGQNKCLTWETMEFCTEECLSNYQNYLGSHCACCNNAVQNSSLGKFCVRFGSDIKQFCSNTCLEEFKKGLKVCTFCQKDISNGGEGFLAAVGDKGQFKDFCSQHCMEKYDSMNNPASQIPKMSHCSACKKLRFVKIELTHEENETPICSELCYAAFKYAHKITQHKCDQCHTLFASDTPSSEAEEITVQTEGSGKRFCSKMCLNIFVLSFRKIVPCSWCKVKKYNFDMIEKVDANNIVQLFCSLNCLSLHKVSLSATSSRSIKCDYCTKAAPAQYHLTMSDASVRNFCSYNCVAKFQNQYPTVQNSSNLSGAGTTSKLAQSGGQSRPSSQNSTSVTTAASQQSRTQSTTYKPASSNVVSLKTMQQQASAITIPKVPMSRLVVPSPKSSVQTVTQQVIIKPPQPKMLKNKGTLCKPIMVTKGASCRPHPYHKSTQSDFVDKDNCKIIPFPVPVYVPLPMHMYSMPTPVVLPIPIPIPVPIFIPTLKDSTEEIMASIKEIKEKMPKDPYQADLLVMAEIVADRDSGAKNDDSVNSVASNDETMETSSLVDDAEEKCSTKKTVETYDVERLLQVNTNSSQDEDDEANACEANGELAVDTKRQWHKRPASNGSPPAGFVSKKIKHDPAASDINTISASTILLDKATNLQYKFGVNAWKNWVIKKNQQLEKSQSNRKLKLFKTDILQLSADELNYSLCLFVKEVRNPAGGEYSADSIYYLCLGIQQYLFLNNRVDNILTDANFEKFTECLNDKLLDYELNLIAQNAFTPRINPEILWESRQLGAHSPHVLLNTLLYFNAKYFGLRTVEDHLKMSFSLVVKHWKKTGKSNTTCLKYYSPAPQVHQSTKGQKRKKEYLEQIENCDNPLRCPVKLYEFYLLKCPESIKSRSDVYYLHPERSCVPDSPVWYSTQALGRDQLNKMLQRAKMIKGIFED